mmetsp:Transcript_15736/g.48704  ORF Transcript_15736/g.48704 Transcript_15736/m.48704 type:complete len:167 (+) Transcript_15736:644-1144(+)
MAGKRGAADPPRAAKLGRAAQKFISPSRDATPRSQGLLRFEQGAKKTSAAALLQTAFVRRFLEVSGRAGRWAVRSSSADLAATPSSFGTDHWTATAARPGSYGHTPSGLGTIRGAARWRLACRRSPSVARRARTRNRGARGSSSHNQASGRDRIRWSFLRSYSMQC